MSSNCQQTEDLKISALLKNTPLCSVGSQKAHDAPHQDRTYTSVVMNPVSSERKRKRMKRQQQMETARNDMEHQTVKKRRPALPTPCQLRRKPAPGP